MRLTPGPLVFKFGGELLEEVPRLEVVVGAMARVAAAQPQAPLAIVHGGGREIDGALKLAGIETRQVDGLRITDEAALDVVVSVLAGAVNTRFVAALAMAGVAAVGLTGADDACGLTEPAPPHRAVDGRMVDLGRVGIPSSQTSMRLFTTLFAGHFVPVIAGLGLGRDGKLFNVNADTFAGHLAGRLRARRFVLAGTTPGVTDDAGQTIGVLDLPEINRLIHDRTATAGMVVKLRASEHALVHGVGDVLLVDGRDGAALAAAAFDLVLPNATRIVQTIGGRPF